MALQTVPGIRSAKIGPWRGMNEKLSADTLPPNVAADLQNVLLDETPGAIVKRLGTRAQAALPSGLPPRDAYIFSKLDGTAYQLVSDGISLYYTTDPSSAAAYTLLITGLSTDGFMEFETAENRVWMSNGIDPVMSWDGTTLLKYDRAFTSTTDLTTVDSTHITHAGLTSSDNYWNGMKLVFTVGANVGTVVTATAYVQSTKTLTFTPAVSGIQTTDRFSIGVVIPKGSCLRFWDGHLFDGCTTDNAAELRFHEISDPDTGALITIDNPRAWPAQNELALNVIDQERLWGISPVLRDRVLVHKASGIWRLERDPLVRYRLELVSRAVGSRFPDTWAEKKNLLYFLGQDKDGLPDIYKTDMVDVTLVDPDGGIEPTLRALQQPNSVQQNRTFTTSDDFNSGTKSTGVATDNGLLSVGGFATNDLWNGFVSRGAVAVGDTEGAVNLSGIPNWEVRYEGDVLPTVAAPPWVNTATANTSDSIVSSVLTIASTAGPQSYLRSRAGALSQLQDSYMAIKARSAGSWSFNFGLWNGAKGVYVVVGPFAIFVNGVQVSATSALSSYHTWDLLLTAAGTWKLWLDGVKVASGTAGTSTLNKVQFGVGDTTADPLTVDAAFGFPGPGPAFPDLDNQFDFVYYHTNLAEASLIPDTLPTSAQIVVLVDYTRVPAALLRHYAAATLNSGTVAFETWTATASDFSSGTDPAGYVAVSQGAVPTSLVKRYERIRLTLTRSDVVNGPVVTAMMPGVLWLSPAIHIGPNITAWRTFVDTLTKPSGSDQTIQIRNATVTGTPAEGDWSAWATIVNGNNIGTILSDTGPSIVSRWVQLKVEEGVSSSGAVPSVDAMVVNWTEGSAKVLPVRAVVHKKRYLLTAASSSQLSANDIILVCDRNDQWTKFRGLSLNAMVHYQSNLYGLDAGAATQRLMDIAGLYNDDGVAIDAFLISREETFDAGHLKKNLRWSYLEWDRSVAASMTTYYRRTGDSDFTGSGTFSFGSTGKDVRQNFPVGTVGKRIQRKYRNNNLDENMAMMNEVFYFDIRPVQP